MEKNHYTFTLYNYEDNMVYMCFSCLVIISAISSLFITVSTVRNKQFENFTHESLLAKFLIYITCYQMTLVYFSEIYLNFNNCVK